ncbi:501cd93b-0610-43be-b893-5f587b9550fc-CDS [Sclerotinia trifoliorum]|uniref:501cd93b-0610-43be-b893-5f587b9550fc-CDS n=1 Tax=Sclerotinia trifoliorum TaxID=28548 RepID=A0A8H2VLP7_9HELO|nr:501cd93b-0610-43be-b893-5f587b9550fc-CDS [Sclerotinia trifoliorum]
MLPPPRLGPADPAIFGSKRSVDKAAMLGARAQPTMRTVKTAKHNKYTMRLPCNSERMPVIETLYPSQEHIERRGGRACMGGFIIYNTGSWRWLIWVIVISSAVTSLLLHASTTRKVWVISSKADNGATQEEKSEYFIPHRI